MDKNSSKASALLSSENQEAQKLFSLYSRDVDGAIISYRLFTKIKNESTQNTARISEIIHHASCFICAARRAARLLETLKSKKSYFKCQVANVIELEWKKKHSFFHNVRLVRDAIEHIDDKDNNNTKLSFYNMSGNILKVTDEHSISIDDEALEKVTSSRDNIVKKILENYNNA